MSKSKSSVEDRYNAVILAKQGVPLLELQRRYSITPHTIRRLIARYDKEGISGLKEMKGVYYPEATKLAALHDYETKGLSLREITDKYCIPYGTFKSWRTMYEAYKRGDKFALSGGKALHKCDIPSICQSIAGQTAHRVNTMQESKEKEERRKALSRLSKKELQELLLDREAELDILKNLEALDREREDKRHAILRGLSKD